MPADSRYRSVLLIIADDWSPIAGCYGNKVIQTPHIDALAARGTTFDHAFCTTPSCAASRASLLTGQHSHTHGQYGHSHDIHHFRTLQGMPTVPSVLNPLGFKTAMIGKTHVAPHDVYPFHVFDTGGTSSKKQLAGHLESFLNDTGSAPFYAHVAPGYPHRVGRAFGYERFTDEFDDVTYDPADVIVPDFLPDTPETRQDLANYYQAVTRYDACVGAMLEVLEKSGRADETLVLVLTDHGMPFPGAKASPFESGHHCPLIIAQPEPQKQGLRSDALLNWVDLAPTIYDWVGVSVEACPDLPGRSLVPVLEETHAEGWDETFYSHSFHEVTNYFPYRVLRGRKYKFVRNLAWQLPMPLPTDLFRSPTWTEVREKQIEMMGRRPTERVLHHPREGLYDIENDPVEANNLIDDPKLAGVADEMREKLMRFRSETRDPWLEVDFQENAPGAPDGGP